MNVKSSIIAPLSEIEPTIFSFSNWILSFWSIASSLEILTKLSFCSKLGASEFCSVLFFSAKFWFLGWGSGAKNNE